MERPIVIIFTTLVLVRRLSQMKNPDQFFSRWFFFHCEMVNIFRKCRIITNLIIIIFIHLNWLMENRDIFFIEFKIIRRQTNSVMTEYLQSNFAPLLNEWGGVTLCFFPFHWNWFQLSICIHIKRYSTINMSSLTCIFFPCSLVCSLSLYVSIYFTSLLSFYIPITDDFSRFHCFLLRLDFNY